VKEKHVSLCLVFCSQFSFQYDDIQVSFILVLVRICTVNTFVHSNLLTSVGLRDNFSSSETLPRATVPDGPSSAFPNFDSY
jgi:hypothetical protein